MLLAQSSNELTTGDWIIAASIALIAIVLAQVVRRLIFRIGGQRGIQAQALKIVARFVSYVIVLGGIVYGLTAVGVDLAPILGLIGILGLAIALAVQDIFSNFIAGIILLLRRPFTPGDEVGVGDEYAGIVEDINLRVTQIRQADGVAVFVPNADVLSNAIINTTQRPLRRTTLAIGVAYDTDLTAATAILTDAAGGVDGVAEDPAPSAFVHEFGDSSINYAVNFWHRSGIADEWSVRHEVAVAIKAALDAASIEIPFPQRVLISTDD